MKRIFMYALLLVYSFVAFTQTYADPADLLSALKQESVNQAGLKPFLAVSPARFEVDLNARDAKQTRTITLVNLSKTEQKISVEVNNFSLDEDNAAVNVEPNEQSLDQWLVINPLNFTIAPEASQTVRFAIRPRAKPEPGEHRAMIYFTQSTADNIEKLKVNLNVQVGVPVYAHSGSVTIAGGLDDIAINANFQQIKLSVKAHNDGNKNLRVNGGITVWKEEQFSDEDRATEWLKDATHFFPDATHPDSVVLVRTLNQSAILPGHIRTIETVIDLPTEAGDYVLGVYARAVDSEQIKFVRFKR